MWEDCVWCRILLSATLCRDVLSKFGWKLFFATSKNTSCVLKQFPLQTVSHTQAGSFVFVVVFIMIYPDWFPANLHFWWFMFFHVDSQGDYCCMPSFIIKQTPLMKALSSLFESSESSVIKKKKLSVMVGTLEAYLENDGSDTGKWDGCVSRDVTLKLSPMPKSWKGSREF